ncbi:unnamed protein product [Paramecium pentaurelia]|uniref:Uncharacterized protein n=1 Tax=Paramecium pentaurelia TaxID=43138 RepID=A0A8S1YKQ7_9CILI|nr:unnamed protein product [Paramecium pentaurelia]
MNSKASQIRSIQRALNFRDHNVPFWTVLDVLEDQQRTSVRVQTYIQSLKDVQNYLMENQERWSEVFANVGLLKEIQQILIVDMSLIVYKDYIHELLVGCQQEQQNAITRRIGQKDSDSWDQSICLKRCKIKFIGAIQNSHDNWVNSICFSSDRNTQTEVIKINLTIYVMLKQLIKS